MCRHAVSLTGARNLVAAPAAYLIYCHDCNRFIHPPEGLVFSPWQQVVVVEDIWRQSWVGWAGGRACRQQQQHWPSMFRSKHGSQVWQSQPDMTSSPPSLVSGSTAAAGHSFKSPFSSGMHACYCLLHMITCMH